MKEKLTKLYPMVQFKKDTWEIDEFDLTGAFLLVGSERALLIDCGYGVGDLRGAVEMLTDKPVTLVISHAHPDHCGGAWQWQEAWTHERSPLITGEASSLDAGKSLEEINARRRQEICGIAERVRGHMGYLSSMFRTYGYDPETMHEPSADEPKPVYHAIQDGHKFDLGGGRVVTAYHCPGHTEDELVFLDPWSGTLFTCDALNYNVFLREELVDDCLRSLERIRGWAGQVDTVINSHHDYRAMGAGLGEDCLPNLVTLIGQVRDGTANPCTMPSFWGDGSLQTVYRLGKNFLSVKPKGQL